MHPSRVLALLGLFGLLLVTTPAFDDHPHCEGSTFCYDLLNVPASHEPYRISCSIHNTGNYECRTIASLDAVTCSLFIPRTNTIVAEQTLVCDGRGGARDPINTGPDHNEGCEECGRGACPAYCPGPMN